MKKNLLLFVLAISAICAHAQNATLSPQVIASAGNYVSAGGISLSYTVGELAAIQTFTSANDSIILTQGFQQPNDIVSGLINIEKGEVGSFSVYPIPAYTTIWYGYQFNEPGKAEVSMFNILGQRMDYSLSENYTSGKLIHSFDCTSYASGNYMLSVKFTKATGQETILTKKIQIITQ
jgi:hypothetical protein